MPTKVYLGSHSYNFIWHLHTPQYTRQRIVHESQGAKQAAHLMSKWYSQQYNSDSSKGSYRNFAVDVPGTEERPWFEISAWSSCQHSDHLQHDLLLYHNTCVIAAFYAPTHTDSNMLAPQTHLDTLLDGFLLIAQWLYTLEKTTSLTGKYTAVSGHNR